jgi:NAD(P)H-flavin reductase
MFRSRTGFTRKLRECTNPDQDYWAWIDGPFGPSLVQECGFAQDVSDYGHILMVMSGIGIAAQLPYIKELLQRRHRAEVRTQRISLVWRLDRAGDWESARDWLQQLVEQDKGYVSHSQRKHGATNGRSLTRNVDVRSYSLQPTGRQLGLTISYSWRAQAYHHH